MGIFQGIRDMLAHHMFWQIGDETFQRIAQAFLDLAHDRGAGQARQRVERALCPIAVGIRDFPYFKHAIVQPGANDVAQRIMGLDGREIVRVVAYACHVAERIDEALRQKEMSPRMGEFGGSVLRVPGIKDAPRRRP